MFRKSKNDYIKFIIIPSFLVRGLSKVEVERDGLKQAINKGEVEIKFDAFLLKDYDDKWQGPVSRFLREVYDRFIIKKQIESFEDQLNTELYKLIDEIKSFLQMHKFE